MASNYSPGARGYRGGSSGGRRNDGPKKPDKPSETGPGFWLFIGIAIIILLGITLGPMLVAKYFGFI